MMEEDETNLDILLLIEEASDVDPRQLNFQLSPSASNGHTSPKVLKFTGMILGLQVNVLVDTGSFHNIIQP